MPRLYYSLDPAGPTASVHLRCVDHPSTVPEYRTAAFYPSHGTTAEYGGSSKKNQPTTTFLALPRSLRREASVFGPAVIVPFFPFYPWGFP